MELDERKDSRVNGQSEPDGHKGDEKNQGGEIRRPDRAGTGNAGKKDRQEEVGEQEEQEADEEREAIEQKAEEPEEDEGTEEAEDTDRTDDSIDSPDDSADSPDDSLEDPRGRSPKGKKVRVIVLIVELAALAAVIVLLYMETRLEKMQRADLTGEDLHASTEAVLESGRNIAEEDTDVSGTGNTENTAASTGDKDGADASFGDTQSTESRRTYLVENAPTDTYREIALFGVDSTQGELDQKTRSDAIMILCIDETTNDARLVSVYRDTLLNLSDGTYNKCNAAYAKGGAEQAIRMLNENLDLNISDFVTIGFSGLTDVINALGGVEIDVDERELAHINDYQLTMAQELGVDYTEVTSTGLQTLDGLQATAYCRVRYTYGWDYRRAARQREVMYQIIEKAKEASPATLAKVATDLFPEVYTSYDMTNLASDISKVYDITMEEESDPDAMQNGIPLLEYRIQAVLGNALGDCVVPRSLTDNVKWLHANLFGEEDYQPSKTVQEYSDYIDEFTKDAVPEEMTDADHT